MPPKLGRSSPRPRWTARGSRLALLAALTLSLGPAPATDGAPLRGATGADLRRRGFVGFEVSGEAPEGNAVPEGKTVRVRAVAPASPAESAGLLAGDVLTTWNGAALRDVSHARDLLRAVRGGDPVVLGVARKGQPKVVEISAKSVPLEEAGDLLVDYRSFVSQGARLRAILTLPGGRVPNPAAGLLPGLLLVPGVGAGPADPAGYAPFREIAHALSRLGYAVLRYDPRGVGDSEGGPYPGVGYLTEAADAEAAFDFLAADPRVDPRRVFVFGHAMGGATAARIGHGERSVAGISVCSTIGRPLLEYLAETTAHGKGGRDRVERIFSGLRMGLLERLLDRAVLQQRVTSENVANVATPGYRRREVEFRGLLQEAEAEALPTLRATHPRHILLSSEMGAGPDAKVRESLDHGFAAGDVNNVDIDREMADLAATKGAYDVAAELMKRRFQELRAAIHGRSAR